MNDAKLETGRMMLTLKSPEEVQADIEAFDESTKKQVSPDWLRRIAAAASADPWLHGFRLSERSTATVLGTAGFKAPPDAEGMVEIAYGIAPEYQGRGYATEAANALVDFAFSHSSVRLVRAHTLPEKNASTRVLTKCGFQFVGAVNDPEDGPVWRWEKPK